jgi:hypothetical protein
LLGAGAEEAYPVVARTRDVLLSESARGGLSVCEAAAMGSRVVTEPSQARVASSDATFTLLYVVCNV